VFVVRRLSSHNESNRLHPSKVVDNNERSTSFTTLDRYCRRRKWHLDKQLNFL